MKKITSLTRSFLCINALCICLCFSGNAQSSGYVTVDCNSFYINGTPYRPLVINYLIEYANVDPGCSSYYPAPLWHYSNAWIVNPNSGPPCVNPLGYVDRPGYQVGAASEQTNASQKLTSDLLKIKQMGFNTLRVFTERPFHSSEGGFYYRTGNLTKDFTVVDALLLAIRNHNLNNSDNLKAILVLGNNHDWDDYTGFKAYMEAFANRYKNYPEVMAYDLLNEPDQTNYNPYHYNSSLPNDKYRISNWITEWYYSIKKFDPNHLVTIGLSYSVYTLGWDPNTMPIDFVSLHFYSGTNSLSISQERAGSYLYYAAKNLTKPWIIGETGYSGTSESSSNGITGSEANQKAYAAYTLQNSVDCGCKAYSWWQYQEVDWGLDDWQNYLGLIKRWNSPTSEGAYKAIVDPALPSPPFAGYAALAPNVANCAAPASYYNNGNFAYFWTGTVRNESGVPIPDAFVLCMANSSTVELKTYTDNAGNFKIYLPAGSFSFSNLRISAPGYNTIVYYGPAPVGSVFTITKVNYNNWTKKWTNDINNYIGSWGINDLDKFCNLDYDGDGKEDLLCLQNHGGNYDWATLLKYDNASANWVQSWTNSGSDWIGSWHQQVAYNDLFLTGDFNADGKDDLLSMQNFGSGDWYSLQKFVSGAWTQLNTNSGNDYIGPWKIETTDEFKVGDFNGDNKDDLFCVRKTTGNSDWFSILNYDPASNSWKYLTIGGVQITNWGSDYIGSWKINPIDKYYIGNFDGLAGVADEILFAQCTGGSGDWMTLQKLNASSFTDLWTNSGSASPAIYPYRNNLIIGNFDEDSSDEFLGFSTWATKFDYSSGSFVSDWNTGSSARFSDWDVVSSTPNYRFIKTNKYSPDQLMVFKKFAANYLVNMYSYNRIPDCAPTRSMIASEDTNEPEKNPEQLSFLVYPNPAYDKATISINQNSYLNSKVYITSVQGIILEKIDLSGLEAGNQTIELNMDNYPTGVYLISFISNQGCLTKKISRIR